jgi:hypothetical protein
MDWRGKIKYRTFKNKRRGTTFVDWVLWIGGVAVIMSAIWYFGNADKVRAEPIEQIRTAAIEEAWEAPDPCGLTDVLCGDEITLDAIAVCESNRNYEAQNPHSSAYGKYQILASTWREAARATGATDRTDHADQETNAAWLLATKGTTPWNASKKCWGERI